MTEATGWLIDLYADENGVALWILCQDDRRIALRMDFPITFYASGAAGQLREAWIFLREKQVTLARETRRDLFSGEIDLLAVTVPKPSDLKPLFFEFSQRFPKLEYYDADIPLQLRFAARTGVSLLCLCRVEFCGNRLNNICELETPWVIDSVPIPLRILELAPDIDPAIQPPEKLWVSYDRVRYCLDLQPARAFDIAMSGVFKKVDPDLILTDYGDSWIFHHLKLNPNRDPAREALIRKAKSHFSYGQMIFRDTQVHLFGRWHIDRHNAQMFSEYGLDGVLEEARVTGLGVQDAARKSPGAGITAMQQLTALRNGILIPVSKQQAEDFKTLGQLIAADKGGMIYQPLIGVFSDVAQIDFASMYPSIMVNHNISPETIGKTDQPEGLIPKTLRPLLEKRLALKRLYSELNPRDCRVKSLKNRSAALKWLLVVCYGYLGFHKAKFGKIESYEAVTETSRELLLRAKDIAEDMGFNVLHMYIDCLFVQKPGCKSKADFDPLLESITSGTGISIVSDGIYRWVAFLSSRRDARVPVPNSYFGVFQDGECKVRGIAMRRHDTPAWVSQTQEAVLNCLAQAESLDQVQQFLPEALRLAARAKYNLRTGRSPPEDLLVSMRLSRPVEAYKATSATARAARLLQEAGHTPSAGQMIHLIHTLGKPGVWVYGQGAFDFRTLNIPRYFKLLDRAVDTILGSFLPENASDQLIFSFAS